MHVVCTQSRRNLCRRAIPPWLFAPQEGPALVNAISSRASISSHGSRPHGVCPQPADRGNVGSSVTVRTPAAELAYPQISAARRAASMVIERGHLPGIAVAAYQVVPVSKLLAYLVDPARTPGQLDTVWQTLIERARRDADWQLVALGMAAPRLARIASRAAGRRCAHTREEITAAVLDGFAEALLTLTPDPAKGLLFYQLVARAQAGAQKVLDRFQRECRRDASGWEKDEVLPRLGHAGRVPNHPDIALARLVARGVLTTDEAELIGRHRIEHTTLRQLGQERGWYPMQTTRALRAAERKVAAALGHRLPEPARRRPLQAEEMR